MDTLAPPQRLQPSSSLPSLPTEIIHRIVRLALPRLSFGTFRERYDTLLRFARVNKLWGELAQKELVRHVRVVKRNSEELVQIIKAIPSNRRPAAQSLWVTKRLPSNRLQGSDVVACASQLPGLRKLEAVTEYGGISSLDFGALSAAAPGLEKLLLDDVFMYPHPSEPSHLRLHNLRQLALTLFDAAEVAAVLSNADLPHLESLLLMLDAPSEYDTEVLVEAVAMHAPRLLSFGLTKREVVSPELPPKVWSAFAQLKDLLINGDTDIPAILAHLPTSLTCLRVFALSELDYTLTPLVSALNTETPTIASLRKLVMTSLPEASPWDSNEGLWQQLQDDHPLVRRWCQHTQVEMVEQPVRGFDFYLEGLQDLLDLWSYV